MNSLIHLPACLTKADVYNLAYDDLTQNGVLCYFLHFIACGVRSLIPKVNIMYDVIFVAISCVYFDRKSVSQLMTYVQQ